MTEHKKQQALHFFANQGMVEIDALENRGRYWVDCNMTHSWYTLQEGMNTYLVSGEGCYVANLNTGEYALIVNYNPQSVGGAGTAIQSITSDGYGNIQAFDTNGGCTTIDMSSINAPLVSDITTVQDAVNMATMEASNNQAEIIRLKELVEALQPKEKKLTFVKQNMYKLKNR